MSVLVGKQAPEFDCKAVINGGEVADSYTLSALKGKYVVLFFYPLDFTFVCPTELHAFQDKLAQVSESELTKELDYKLPHGDNTVRGALIFFAYHEAWHFGQIAYVRKCLGMEGLVPY